MPQTLLDRVELDFRQVAPRSGRSRIKLTITNVDPGSILHVGLKPPAPWLDLIPAQFALAPGQHQAVVAELRPDNTGVDGMYASDITVYAQYFTIQNGKAVPGPGDITYQIHVIPPHSDCPNCGAELGNAGAGSEVLITECRKCGERIRLCPICGTPNTWKARVCLSNDSHILRTQMDWQSSPGGNAAHSLEAAQRVGCHLARVWSAPSFPTTRSNAILEWSAPIVCYGIVACAHLDPERGSAYISGYEAATGVPLWEVELGDTSGIYPDRGGTSVSGNLLTGATVGGSVTAIDIIRGVKRWSAKTEAGVYGGVVSTLDEVVVPAGSTLHVLDSANGGLRFKIPLKGKINATPAISGTSVYAASDDCSLSAFSLLDGALLWNAATDGPFDASPILYDDAVVAMTTGGTVYSFSCENGFALWTASIGARGTAASPIVTSSNMLVLAGEDGLVHLLDPATGHTIRSKRITTSPLRCTPASSGGTIFFGADDGSFYSLDQDFNAVRAYETTPGSRIISAGLAIYGDMLFGTSTNGLLYALRATE
jgi:outer membrane protein assembly factor BamB